MANMTETELRRRLKKLESEPTASTALVSRVGDQYEYDKDFVYIAYASALANLSNGSITNQSDATDFQFSPYNDSGTLMAYRGYFINKSIYQSGDPTDYTWESTSGSAGYTSSERAFTTNTGLQNTLGNPTKPGSGVTWGTIATGDPIPANAVYYAKRFTLTTTDGAVTSNWDIEPVGKHVDTTVVTADGIKAENIDLDGTLNVTANSGAIRWGKTDGDDITNSGLFIGRDSNGNPKFVIGSQSSFIYFNGTLTSAVGVSESATVGTETNIYTSGTNTFTISPVLGTIDIQLSGGGGGGGTGSTVDGSGPGSVGGTSSVVVYKADGTVRTGTGALNITASGGSGGSRGGGNGNTGGNGSNFTAPSGATDPPFNNATGGTGGVTTTNPLVQGAAGTAGIPSSGGGGAGGGGGGGGGGGAGSFNSTTYTIVNSTDYLVITVGAGGAGKQTVRDNAGGDGARGAVRIKGVLA